MDINVAASAPRKTQNLLNINFTALVSYFTFALHIAALALSIGWHSAVQVRPENFVVFNYIE